MRELITYLKNNISGLQENITHLEKRLEDGYCGGTEERSEELLKSVNDTLAGWGEELEIHKKALEMTTSFEKLEKLKNGGRWFNNSNEFGANITTSRHFEKDTGFNTLKDLASEI